MEDCDKYYEKIIFYDDLSDAEKEKLQAHLESCDECRDDYEKINSIIRTLNDGLSFSHPDHKQIVRLIIFENSSSEPDYDGKKLSAREILDTRKHLDSCPACMDRYDEMKAEYEDLEQYIMESQIPNYQLGQRPAGVRDRFSRFIKNLQEIWNRLIAYPKPKYILAPVTVVAILLLLVIFIPFFKGTEITYQSLAKLENKQITYLTRGSGANELQQGISDFNDGQYNESIRRLEGFIASNLDHPNRAFAEYICGLAYLFYVNDVIDDLQPVDEQYIDNGIRHLQASLSLSSNLRIQEEDAWFLGKAYLMKGDASNAIKYFEEVKSLRGRHYQKSQEILADIKKNLISSK